MNCTPLINNKGEHIGFACGRGRPKKQCYYCHKWTYETFLCDYPLFDKDGKPLKKKNGHKVTCDVLMCGNCTQKGVSQDTDFCRKHYPLALAAYERKKAKEQPLLKLVEEKENGKCDNPFCFNGIISLSGQAHLPCSVCQPRLKGMAINAAGLVKKDSENVFTVQEIGSPTQYKVVNLKNKFHCECSDFQSVFDKVKGDGEYYCDHLQAVKFYLLGLLKEANDKLSQDMEKIK